jgi:septum formation protein
MEDKRNSQTNPPGAELAEWILPQIVLASGSPRRAEILQAVQWPFEVVRPDIDETRRPNEDAVSYVKRLAKAKAEAVSQRVNGDNGVKGSPIVAADTTVVIGEHILEKPLDQDDARRMLRELSGKWHQVITGVAVIDGAPSSPKVECETTEVKFAVMSEGEIDWYVKSGEPMDKAGGYAIQERGARFIEEVRGDYFNIVGLPIRLLYEMVR